MNYLYFQHLTSENPYQRSAHIAVEHVSVVKTDAEKAALVLWV